jgi:hypothetical protein
MVAMNHAAIPSATTTSIIVKIFMFLECRVVDLLTCWLVGLLACWLVGAVLINLSLFF